MFVSKSPESAVHACDSPLGSNLTSERYRTLTLCTRMDIAASDGAGESTFIGQPLQPCGIASTTQMNHLLVSSGRMAFSRDQQLSRRSKRLLGRPATGIDKPRESTPQRRPADPVANSAENSAYSGPTAGAQPRARRDRPDRDRSRSWSAAPRPCATTPSAEPNGAQCEQLAVHDGDLDRAPATATAITTRTKPANRGPDAGIAGPAADPSRPVGPDRPRPACATGPAPASATAARWRPSTRSPLRPAARRPAGVGDRRRIAGRAPAARRRAPPRPAPPGSTPRRQCAAAGSGLPGAGGAR